MAALTSQRNTILVGAEGPIPVTLYLPVTAAVKCIIGGIAVVDGNGYVKPGVAAASLIAVGIFDTDKLNLARGIYDNTVGAAANGSISAYVKTGVFLLDTDGSLTQADVMSTVGIVDDHTVKHGTGGTSVAGLCLGINQGPAANQAAVMIFPGVTSFVEG